MSPDEQVFRAHVDMATFQNGVDRARWRLISVTWPHVIIAVSAAPRANSPTEYAFRFECTNYPQAAPTAQPWDAAHDTPLPPAQWPTGGPRITAVFNPAWKEGQCLYLPCDRRSLEGHPQWPTQYPSMMWSNTSDITLYLREIYELLASSQYTGIRST